jgi:hypothetical protein
VSPGLLDRIDLTVEAPPVTAADLEGGGPVRRVHVAEALIYRRVAPMGDGVEEARALASRL